MSLHSRSKPGRVAAAFVLALAALALLAGEALLADTPFDPLAALQTGKPSGTAGDQTYEVVPGDCLWAIAERFMGDGARWTEIFDANSDQISNPNLIYPGQRFQIPGGTGGGGGGTGPGKASVSRGGIDARGRNEAFQKLPVAHGHISSRFGPRRSPCAGCSSYHQGLDIGAGRGTPVYATGPGRVVHVGSSYGGGNTVTIDHGNGYRTSYIHLQHGSFRVRQGDQVSAGQQIAGVNSTGAYTTGDHLHFSVQHNGRYVNPEDLLNVPNSF
jgi:murein DD-endopeptidase MepM/ murein hydrolase activator NlpD